jgi:multidrug transporter EmrE-like cation transporter
MGLVFLSTLSAASGQILLKFGTHALELDLILDLSQYPGLIIKAAPLMIGYILYALAAGMLIVSLKYGELSVLYPIYAMNFIWVAILSPIFFPGADSMNMLKWFGVFAIIGGVILIGKGGTEDGVKD